MHPKQANDHARRIAELLDQGLSRRQIGAQLGVSGPRVTQIIGNNPQLLRHHRRPGQVAARLHAYRQDLVRLRHATNDLAKLIRRDLRELDEELEAYAVDHLLGLRAG